MNRFWLVAIFGLLLSFRPLLAQESAGLTGMDPGSLSWSNRSADAIQTVEWTPDLSSGTWYDSWNLLQDMAPSAGQRQQPIPMYYRVIGRPVATNIPAGGALLVATSGTQTLYASLSNAYAAATAGDFIFLSGGAYTIGSFPIEKPDLTFVGIHPPAYDATGRVFRSGTRWQGRVTINTTPGLRFLNIGFEDPVEGGDPFLCSGTSTNERRLYLYGCVFAGNGSNPHNAEFVGRDVQLDSCKSYNGRHNLAFKTTDLVLNHIYSYNGSLSGIILKGSTNVGDFANAHLNDITLEGPPGALGAKGIQIEAFDTGSGASHIRINRLRARRVNCAVYIWPHAGSDVNDIHVSDAESRDCYGEDFILQAGATNVTFMDCRAYNNQVGKSFVNFGSAEVRLLQCTSSKPAGQRTFGIYKIAQVNGSL